MVKLMVRVCLKMDLAMVQSKDICFGGVQYVNTGRGYSSMC